MHRMWCLFTHQKKFTIQPSGTRRSIHWDWKPLSGASWLVHCAALVSNRIRMHLFASWSKCSPMHLYLRTRFRHQEMGDTQRQKRTRFWGGGMDAEGLGTVPGTNELLDIGCHSKLVHARASHIYLSQRGPKTAIVSRCCSGNLDQH